ncbi:MAG: XTP/dITP diphosphatase [Caldilineaceae bacterium]|nr:XTP/dITP diphosphatase [Caldilineaceae bacterium]
MSFNNQQKLLIATHNAGKIREYRALLAELPFEVVSLAELGITLDVDETGVTFAENACLKAQAYAALAHMWTWADDSGLEVDALDGRPGVYSARFAGAKASDAANNAKLIAELHQLAQLGNEAPSRRARFRCVVALAAPDGHIYTCEDSVEGEIVDEPRGDHGFGYDPHFYLPTMGCTMAQLPAEVKNSISHRGKAARQAEKLLHTLVQG